MHKSQPSRILPWRIGWIPVALLLPLVTFYAFMIGGGLFSTIVESSGYLPILGLEQPGFLAYRSLFHREGFLRDFGFTFRLAFLSSLSSTILGVTIAHAIVTTKARWLRWLVRKSMNLGLVLPYVYGVFLVTTFFSQAGFISRLFHQLHWMEEPRDFPALLYDPAGIGIFLVFVLKGAPFVALFVVNLMERVHRDYQDVARTLCAGKWTILRKILLPLCSTMIVWCTAVLFAYNLGSFEVPYLLGALRPESLPSRLYSLHISPDLLMIPQAMAMSVLLFVTGLVGTAAYAILLKRILGGRRR